MEPAEIDMPETLRWAILSFNVDRITAEVTTALSAASIESIVLKGPTIATWLYTNDQPRLYSDSDLLIQRGDWSRAQAVMEQLGFEDGLSDLAHPRMESGAGYPWGRPADRASVDLHFTLFGLGADPQVVWDALHSDAEREIVGGLEVRTPSRPARLLHIALHAVQHGGEVQPRPMMDLKVAVAKAPEPTWLEARELAVRLGAGETFSAGLQLTPEGTALATSIGAVLDTSVGATLRLQRVPLAEGFQEMSEAGGIGPKLRIALREMFPSRAFMRWWIPLADRGRLGLATAYAWRLIWLAYRSIPGYLAWRRASRISQNR